MHSLQRAVCSLQCVVCSARWCSGVLLSGPVSSVERAVCSVAVWECAVGVQCAVSQSECGSTFVSSGLMATVSALLRPLGPVGGFAARLPLGGSGIALAVAPALYVGRHFVVGHRE